MKVLKGFLLVAVLMTIAMEGHAIKSEPINFPYKGLVYDGLGVPAADRVAIANSDDAVVYDDVYSYEFIWNEKRYEAELYIFGAMLIHVYDGADDNATREASYWYCFTVSDFQTGTYPVHLPVAR